MAARNSSAKSGAAEIVFFDLETTVPNRAGQRFWVLEFGAIVVCPRNLVELDSYCTLIRPGDLSAVALKSSRSGGITQSAVKEAPPFRDVSDKIFSILDGRVWAGHNIQRFDCVRIREAFAGIGRPAPVPAGIIDSLGVLTEKFGRRAGNMKMATLATYFGLGQQKHRNQISQVWEIAIGKTVVQALQQEAGEMLGNFHAEKKVAADQLLQRLRFPITDLFLIQGEALVSKNAADHESSMSATKETDELIKITTNEGSSRECRFPFTLGKYFILTRSIVIEWVLHEAFLWD
ncbi:hypothetical protein U1Q18_011239 [Sarracenia purpurea var. burkii]